MLTEELKLKIDKQIEELFPPLTKEDYDALRWSIKQNGQLSPIVVFTDGTVIDGHNRLRICKELKKDPWIMTTEQLGLYNIHSIKDALGYAFDINYQGRKFDNKFLLVKAGIKAKLAVLPTSRTKESKMRFYKALSWDTSISLRTIQNVCYILEAIEMKQVPEGMEQKLISGELAIDAAQKTLRIARKIEERISNLAYFPDLKRRLEEKYSDLKYTKNADKKLEREIKTGTSEKEETESCVRLFNSFVDIVKGALEKHNVLKDVLTYEDDGTAFKVSFLIPEEILKQRAEEQSKRAKWLADLAKRDRETLSKIKQEQEEKKQAFREALIATSDRSLTEEEINYKIAEAGFD